MFLSWMISSGEKNSEKNVIYLFIIDWSQQQQKTEKKEDWIGMKTILLLYIILMSLK